MQVVCEACGHAGEAAAVEIVDGAVMVTCAACGVATQLGGAGQPAPVVQAVGDDERDAPPAAAADATVAAGATKAVVDEAAEDESALPEVEPLVADAPRELPPVKCPKCGHRQHNDVSCHKCGLVFANVRDGYRPWEDWPADKQPAIERAQALWAAVEQAPGDAARHAAFVDWCRSEGVITWAAMRYRHWVADHPDDALSHSYLERTVRDAQALAQAMTMSDDGFIQTTRRIKSVMLLIVAALSIVATVVLVKMIVARNALDFP